ncbi:integrase [Haloferula helveola]|uniref:Integrase n=1 Tax=Haloferula helveola TaxID=490095 RepID=A0ABM7RHV2_9BACT|nr:integrase [Haloferula helveola]
MRVFRQSGCKTYRVRFSIRGRQYDEPLGVRSKEAAESLARELVLSREKELAGILVAKIQRESALAPLSELLEQWIEEGLAPDVTEKHRVNCRNKPTRVFRDCDWRRIGDVSAVEFERWRKLKRKGGLQPKTLNDHLAPLSAFLGWMVDQEMIEKNPLRSVKALRVIRDDEKRAFTLGELSSFIRSVPEYRGHLYTVAAFTGLRKAELKALERSRVTLEGTRPRIELAASTTKNRKGGCLVLHPDALASLRWLIANAPDGSRKVFFKGVTQMERFRLDLALAGVAEFDDRGRGLEFHSFRRTFATFLTSSSVSPAVAQKLMRHGDIRLTMNLYTDGHQLEMAGELAKVPRLQSSPISSLKSGKSGPAVSKSGHFSDSRSSSGSARKSLNGNGLVTAVHRCPRSAMADREGFEPSIPFWGILP